MPADFFRYPLSFVRSPRSGAHRFGTHSAGTHSLSKRSRNLPRFRSFGTPCNR